MGSKVQSATKEDIMITSSKNECSENANCAPCMHGYDTSDHAIAAYVAQGMKPEHCEAVLYKNGKWHVTYSEQWYLDNMTE